MHMIPYNPEAVELQVKAGCQNDLLLAAEAQILWACCVSSRVAGSAAITLPGSACCPADPQVEGRAGCRASGV